MNYCKWYTSREYDALSNDAYIFILINILDIEQW